MRSLLRAAFAAACLFACAPAHAQSPKEIAACKADAIRLCRSALDGPRLGIYVCMMVNRAKLSKRCDRVFRSHGL